MRRPFIGRRARVSKIYVVTIRESQRRLTHLSSMPWLRLSFILTITSRGCIFLSPLHFGVVTLPCECISGTNDYYVRPHMYTLPDDDGVMTPDDEINVYLPLSLPLFFSFRLSTHAVQFAARENFAEHRRAYIYKWARGWVSHLSSQPSSHTAAHCHNTRRFFVVLANPRRS